MGVLEDYLSQASTNLLCHGVSAATSTGDLPKWETRDDQMASKELHLGMFFFRLKVWTLLYPFLLWSSKDTVIGPEKWVIMQKEFCKCLLNTHTHTGQKFWKLENILMTWQNCLHCLTARFFFQIMLCQHTDNNSLTTESFCISGCTSHRFMRTQEKTNKTKIYNQHYPLK